MVITAIRQKEYMRVMQDKETGRLVLLLKINIKTGVYELKTGNLTVRLRVKRTTDILDHIRRNYFDLGDL